MMRRSLSKAPNDSRTARWLRAGRFSLLATGMVTVMLVVGAGSASAKAPIEGVWSFNGGKVAIQAQPGGTFVGTVVSPTKFSQCYHPVGEEMWTSITLQPNGSYWGLHQWFFETSECIRNPELGLTAWRVQEASDGSRLLQVCFSEPSSKSQPTIATNGASTGATYGCSESGRISALPAIEPTEVGKYVSFPDNGSCFGRRKMRIHLQDPVNDPFAKIVIKLKSGKVHRRAKLKRHGSKIVAILNLRGLVRSTFKVTVRFTTVLGTHLSAKRTYHRCATSPRPPHKHRHHR